MRTLLLIVFSLLVAACASSPTSPRIVTFTGDYIDARKDPAAKIAPSHKEPLRVPGYLREHDLDASAVVTFIVETDGRTSEIQIVSTTDEEFAKAVCESVSGWRYAPLVKNGTPVRVVIEESFGWRPNRIPTQP
jgi:outer membrane biosynthesis protein TonB